MAGHGGAVLALLVALALSASALDDSMRDSMLIIGSEEGEAGCATAVNAREL
jgi:hypothetical protein